MKKLFGLLLCLCILMGMMTVLAEDTTITVTYNPNYEGGRVTTSTVTGPLTSVTKKIERYGYQLAGWYHDADCLDPVDEEYPVTEDATIYADWEPWSKNVKEMYDNYISEITLANDLALRPHVYTSDSFSEYDLTFSTILTERTALASYFPIDGSRIQSQIEELQLLREELVLLGEEDEGTLYIWGDNMPCASDLTSEDYYLTWTNEGFRPFLVPYYTQDKANAKGNIIVIAGGGYTSRCNFYEGYNVAEFFQSQGYNAYVLQRRVAPFTPDDAQMDLQRSVRYLRYNAEKLGIGATDKIAAIGFSGGSRTVSSAVNKYYGDVQPNVLYPDYIPDAVDAVNSDLQVMLLIYGVDMLDTDNPNIPACFMVTGDKDEYGSAANSAQLFLQLNERCVSAELHIIADCTHGFGLADGRTSPTQKTGSINGAKEWPDLAITFLDVKLGHLPRTNEVGK